MKEKLLKDATVMIDLDGENDELVILSDEEAELKDAKDDAPEESDIDEDGIVDIDDDEGEIIKSDKTTRPYRLGVMSIMLGTASVVAPLMLMVLGGSGILVPFLICALSAACAVYSLVVSIKNKDTPDKYAVSLFKIGKMMGIIGIIISALVGVYIIINLLIMLAIIAMYVGFVLLALVLSIFTGTGSGI